MTGLSRPRAALAAAVIVAGVAGCSGGVGPTPAAPTVSTPSSGSTAPTPTGPRPVDLGDEVNAGRTTDEEWSSHVVVLPNGDKVTCIVWQRGIIGGRSNGAGARGGPSCDWDHVVKAKP